MDFDQAAACVLELELKKARAQGAAHELDCDIAASAGLLADEKAALRGTISRLFSTFGVLNCQVLDDLHRMLLKHEQYVRFWTIRTLGGSGR